jgi:hypothetical protein
MLQLAHKRMSIAKILGLPKRQLNLIENLRAHSDDEIDEETGNYVVARKPERNPRVTTFFQELDAQRKKYTMSTAGRWSERARIRASSAPVSGLSRLAFNLPVDYYAPDYFNALPLILRRRIAGSKPSIALPAPPTPIGNALDTTRTMRRNEFMTAHGNQILEAYNMKDDVELASNASDSDDDDDPLAEQDPDLGRNQVPDDDYMQVDEEVQGGTGDFDAERARYAATLA